MPILRALLIVACAAAGGAEAATYYVRNGGNDSADGRSPATAWATLDKVNSFSFKAGDSVLFHEGERWSGKRLVVNWGGSADSYAVIGSYYLDGGTPRRGYKTSRPTIDGADRVPSGSKHDGLVQVRADRVRVENLAVINSEGRGVNFDQAHSGQVVGVHVENTYTCGIAFIKSRDALVESSTVTESDRQRYEDGLNWCAGIAAVGSARPTIRRNRVEKVYGEGINVNHNSHDALIEDNFVFAARAVGIYADAAPRPTIRRNMVVGTSNSRYWRYDRVAGGGIVLNNESYHYQSHGGSMRETDQSNNARIYGNLVAYSNQGIAFWGQLGTTRFDNTLVYNNTLVDNERQLFTHGKPAPGSIIANNILMSVTSGTVDVDGDFPNVTARSNYFSQGDPGGNLSHASNRYKGLKLARMSGWRSISDPEHVSWQDFLPLDGSSTNGAGDAAHFAKATSADAFLLDFAQRRFATPPDIGALTAAKPASRLPKAPRELAAPR